MSPNSGLEPNFLRNILFFFSSFHFAADAEHHLFTEEGPDDITSSPKSDAASQLKQERSPLLRHTIPEDNHP